MHPEEASRTAVGAGTPRGRDLAKITKKTANRFSSRLHIHHVSSCQPEQAPAERVSGKQSNPCRLCSGPSGEDAPDESAGALEGNGPAVLVRAERWGPLSAAAEAIVVAEAIICCSAGVRGLDPGLQITTIALK